MKKITLGKLVFWFFAILWLAIAIFPVYFTVISSFKADNEIWKTMLSPPRSLMFDNYVRANNVAGIMRATGNSLYLSIASVLLMMICVLMSSYVLARRYLKATKALSMYFTAALMIPLHGALVPIVQMVSWFKLQNSLGVMIVLYSGLNLSLASFIMTGFISGINREIDEAAMMDGCGLFGIVFRIILPIASPGVATASIVAFLYIYNELPLANVLLSKKSLRTISVALLAFRGDNETNLGLIFASIVITIIPILLFYILAQEKVEKGLSAGAVKG